MGKESKDFVTSMAFINTENEEGQPQHEEPKQKPRTKTTGGRKQKQRDLLEPEKKRTRRVQTIFTPELYDKLNAYAWANKKSVNGTIIEAVEEYLRRHK